MLGRSRSARSRFADLERLTADLGWLSTSAEFTLGVVSVSNAQGTIEALAGAYDPNVSGGGTPYARLHVLDGSDQHLMGVDGVSANGASEMSKRDPLTS